MLLEGKKAIVTGGARGIGKEIVVAFMKEGASVYFIDISPSEHMEEYQAIGKETGAEAFYYEGNVADEEGITKTVEQILSDAGNIDILVNNAGITRDNLFFRMSGKEWNDVLSINLSSAFYISKVVARSMAKKRTGSIINISSIVGVIGNAGQANYSASKAGMIGLTKSLAREIGSRGVRVNAVAPGFIKTAMTDKLNDTQKEALLTQIPMSRLGEAEEVASTVLFLASDLSSYISGQVLQVTGGMGM